jgi:hypothetical protein
VPGETEIVDAALEGCLKHAYLDTQAGVLARVLAGFRTILSEVKSLDYAFVWLFCESVVGGQQWSYGSEFVTKVSSGLVTLMSGPNGRYTIYFLHLRGGNSLASKIAKHGRLACPSNPRLVLTRVPPLMATLHHVDLTSLQ